MLAGSAAPLLTAWGAGRGRGCTDTEMPHLPRTPRSAWRIPGLGSPQLRAPGRAPGAASGRGRCWGPRPQVRCSCGQVHGGPGAAKREAASRLLARCRLKPVWSGQVVARQPPGSAPGPPRFQAADASGSPTPLPPPPLRDLSLASSLRSPALLAAGRDLARLDCSDKTRSANPAVGADTWCRAHLVAGVGCSLQGGFSKRNQIHSNAAVGLAFS